MKWSQSGWTGWNGPFSWEPTAKQSCGWNVSFSHRLRLRPPGIKTGRPFIKQVLGLRWWKNSLYPAKPALPKPRLRLRPAGIRTAQAWTRPLQDDSVPGITWECELLVRSVGRNGFHTLYIYYLRSGGLIFQTLPLRRHAKVFIFIYTCRHYQDEYVLHM